MWPVSREDEERTVNPGYDAQLQDHLIEELFRALEHKDSKSGHEALVALINAIMNEGSDETNA